MKKLLLKFLIVILFFPLSLSAVSQKEIEKKCEKAVSLAKEYSNIQLMNELSELHVFLLNNRISEAPYCSKIIVEETEKLDNEKSSIASQFAADMSPSKIRYSFYAAKKIIKSDVKQIKKAFHYFKNGVNNFIYSEYFETHLKEIIKTILFAVFAVLLIFVSAVSIKNASAIKHRFSHAVGFSKFYFVFITAVFAAAPFILFISTGYSVLFILVPVAVIWKNIRRRDKTLLFLITAMLVFADSLYLIINEDMISSNSDTFSYNEAVNTDYEPVSENNKYSLFYKALNKYYKGQYNESVKLLEKIIVDSKSGKELITASQNLLGLNFYFSGEKKTAKILLNTLYSTQRKSAVAENIAKILEDEGLTDDADAIKYTISKGGSVASFPALYFPPSNKIISVYKESPDKLIMAFFLSFFSALLPLIIISLITISFIKIILPSFKISQCSGCGRVICEICSISRDSKHCTRCYLAKQSSLSLYSYDLRKYREIIKKYSVRKMKLALTLSFIPSWGMIYLGRTLRSIVWLFLIVFPATLSLMTSGIIKIILIAAAVLFYVASIIRTYKIADKQK